ncbi:MAG: tyrosine-type recombinase/integrase [Myxococcota bacterium]
MPKGAGNTIRIFKSHMRRAPGGTRKEWSWGIEVRWPGAPDGEKQTGFTKKEAEVVAAKIRMDLIQGHWLGFKKRRTYGITWQELRDQFLAYGKAKGKRSLESERIRFEEILEYFGPANPVQRTTAARAHEFRDWLTERPRQAGVIGQKLAPATINRYMALARAAINHAISREQLPDNPFKGIPPLKERNKRDRICSDGEYRRLLDNTGRDDLWFAIFMAYETGMRRGEIIALTPSMCDFDRRIIRLPAALTKSSQFREVPMTREVVRQVRNWPTGDDGKYISCEGTTITHYFIELCLRLDIKDLRFHDLRHSFATRLRRNGADVLTIMRICGWSSQEIFDRYNTVDDADKLRAVDANPSSNSTGILLKRITYYEERHRLIGHWIDEVKSGTPAEAFYEKVEALFRTEEASLVKAVNGDE